MKNERAKILIVEDDPGMLLTLRVTLESQHSVTSCKDSKEAEAAFERQRFDLILMDVRLPDGDGFGLFSSLRSRHKSAMPPVVFLTAQTGLSDQVLGLSLGAEDYLLKPIHPILLQAKINSKLARSRSNLEAAQEFRVGSLRFDLSTQKVFFESQTESGVREIELTALQFRLLRYMAEREERVFSRAQLVADIWDESVHISERTVDTHMSHLRQLLRDTGCSLESVHGVGYRFRHVK